MLKGIRSQKIRYPRFNFISRNLLFFWTLSIGATKNTWQILSFSFLFDSYDVAHQLQSKN